MKFFGVSKLKSLYYEIGFDFKSNEYIRQFSIRKSAFVTFIGIPIYATKHIFVKANDKESIGKFLAPIF